jgi:hypothetical protein
MVGLMPGLLWAQWPSDPAANMVISDMFGEETIPKIVATSDNGCYLSWWNNTSGHYCMYLQRLNADGIPQWPDNGLLISDNPQDTWLTDYDLAVDNADHAIIALNDLRAGGDLDIYAYRISPNGDFVWGANGIAISDNSGFEPDPRALVTSDGNVVIAWQEESIINLRKLSPDGIDLWDPAIITLTSTYPLSIPRLSAAENDAFVLQILVAQGPNYYNPKHLYAHKFDIEGNQLWGSTGIAVQTAGGFGPQMRPAISSDNAGGAFSYWYDSRNSELHAFAQHILSDGSMAWTTNGVPLSTTAGHLQMSPVCVSIPAIDGIMLFFENTDANQTNIGLYGQAIDSTGARQWGNGGIALVPMNSQPKMLLRANRVESDAVVTYLENPIGDFLNTLLKGIRVDIAGAHVWDPSPVTMTTTVSVKGYHNSTANQLGQVLCTWQDKRTDPDGDIYLQNINPDGTLGPFSPNELNPFSLISPVDGDTIDSCYPHCVWSASLDPVPGYPVSYRVTMSASPDFSNPIESETLSDTTWDCPLCLPYDSTYFWQVLAFNGHAPDRVSDQTFRFVVPSYIGCAYVPGDVAGNGGANGIDVVYLVYYLKGGYPPPLDCSSYCPDQPNPFFAGSDVNGNCAVNGIDVTFYVSFLKGGQPALLYCPECPPAQ